jgi:hypothetical protein
VIIFIQLSPNNLKWQFKKIFEIKFAYVASDTVETSVQIDTHYTAACETVICDSDGVTGDHIMQW